MFGMIGVNMGMYDCVQLICECGEILEEQTKDGNCTLSTYVVERYMSIEGARLANGMHFECPSCGNSYSC